MGRKKLGDEKRTPVSTRLEPLHFLAVVKVFGSFTKAVNEKILKDKKVLEMIKKLKAEKAKG